MRKTLISLAAVLGFAAFAGSAWAGCGHTVSADNSSQSSTTYTADASGEQSTPSQDTSQN